MTVKRDSLWRGWCWVVLLGLAFGVFRVEGADVPGNGEGEVRAWEVAARFYETAAFELAEEKLRGFVSEYPESVHRAEAYLLLAESLFRQAKVEEALALLMERREQGGVWRDRYDFWVGECLVQLARYEEAIQSYRLMLEAHPESERALDALVGQAYALQQTGKAGEAFALLSRSDGLFFRLSQGQEGRSGVALGYLLMGETALLTGQSAAGLELLGRLPADRWPGILAWQRLHLVARLQLALGKTDDAVSTVERLVETLRVEADPRAVPFRSDAVGLAGRVYEQRGDVARAMEMFERNLELGVVEARRREAASELARLSLKQGDVGAALTRLEGWVGQYGGELVVFPLRVAIAELTLRRYFAVPAERRMEGLRSLELARQGLAGVTNGVEGGWVGRAAFAAGWCAWEESRRGDGAASVRLEESGQSFELAGEALPRSVEQAVAWFKAGDVRFLQGANERAAGHYWRVATNYAELPEVRQAVGDHALYQIVRVATGAGDLASGEAAMGMVLQLYPQSYFGDRAVMVFGQALGEAGRPEEARRLFTEFLQKFPSSSLAPELGLAMARTWQQQSDWGNAAAEYDRWLKAHGADHPARGQAMYELAWSAHRSGDEQRALEGFQAFLERFPRHALAPAALHWVADYHFRRGMYDLAEGEYQQIYLNTNWPSSELKVRAWMMAGRSAYRQSNYKDARGYFTDLINRVGTNAPAGVLPEAYFALGDSFRLGADADKILEGFAEAIKAYSKIPQNHPESPLVPLAWGEIGNCHFQLATADAKQYDMAVAAYTNAMAVTAAVPVRSQAEVGLAMCLEAKALLPGATNRSGMQVRALEHYLRVTEGGNLQAGEEADVLWVERAGAAGATLAEQMKRWEVAERLYDRLIELVPVMRQKYEARRDRVRQAKLAPG